MNYFIYLYDDRFQGFLRGSLENRPERHNSGIAILPVFIRDVALDEGKDRGDDVVAAASGHQS